MRAILISLALPTILAACATNETNDTRLRGAERYADDPRLGEEVDRICFASSIDGFSETTRDTVVLRNGRKHYLVEVFTSCAPLDHAMRIGLDSTGGCLRKSDALIVSDSMSDIGETSSFSRQRCLVNGIYEWNPDAEADAPVDDESSEEDTES
ncbi:MULTISPECIES: DUF6491 family protein [Hyphomonas]|jgi:hypothetical protein|uniref:DUF6491 family protein n=1 Tax=Hyphomonas TaxID=85 RepID=UPI000E9527CC|nr:hypothetical protein [Hyphomonas atlantica]|tara:strand:- start:216 stop:677 length:462 start_codon:yes stop_codon:yes gene_type:complete